MYYPSATYRVQLNSSFTFLQLQDIIEYLHKLGISTIYASPITKAMKGSTHGYDVCNPDVISAEIGTEEQLVQLHQSLAQKNMGWLQDIVPNHMAFLCDNERVFDVMERGPQSPYYHYFDVNWNHYDLVYQGKLMVPFIGKDFEEAINDGDIKILFDEKGFHVAYFDQTYPIAFDSLGFIFSLLNDGMDEAETYQLLRKEKAGIDEWKEEKKKWLQSISGSKNKLAEAIEKVNIDKDLLRNFLDLQYYILTWYKVTEQEINFRRFFTVSQLICLRMEDEFVFRDYHKLVGKLIKKDLLQGLRIDHVDGLYNPEEYGEWLRKLAGEETYIIAEKILEYNEDFAADWHMQGTSGYEFLSFTNQLLTDKKGTQKLFSFYKELVPQTPLYEDMVWENKHRFLYTQMGGELENLMHLIDELQLFPQSANEREKLKSALGNLMASFPVYRIYPQSYPLSEEAKSLAKTAFERAWKKAGDAGNELAILKTIFEADGKQPDDDKKLLFLKRLMQFTGPLAAKGVEDTTFYVYNPLISHNEVGDAPSKLGITVSEFHDKMKSRQHSNPYSLNATSTHDTKRGEDARMRINALAAVPDEWIKTVNNWRQINSSLIKTINNKPAPSTNDEYFIYQSLIGAFPEDLQLTDTFKERTYSFLEKALREAKVETTYNEPNTAYEQACKDFISALLDASHPFLDSFLSFLKKNILPIASLYSVAQTIIKITAPGIPDTYQGCELWDISYVDPDNRRPIDYEYRKQLLDELRVKENEGFESLQSFLQQNVHDGRQKLFVTYKMLALRTAHNNMFLQGEYLPLQTGSEHVMAYARRKDNQCIVVVIPFVNDLNEQDIIIPIPVPSTEWKNLFTGNSLTGSSLHILNELKQFPVAVFTSGI